MTSLTINKITYPKCWKYGCRTPYDEECQIATEK
jgi:hypothetical protein